jgi:uncharacterized protein (UPF0332 family)
MSPRSNEFMDEARERAATARELLASNHFAIAVSVGYYAMLYAARAALSESDEYARTHRGTWHLFRDRYVTTDAFDQSLFDLAQRSQTTRERGDYEAITPDRAEAQAVVDGAGEFVAAVERMLDASEESGSQQNEPAEPGDPS